MRKMTKMIKQTIVTNGKKKGPIREKEKIKRHRNLVKKVPLKEMLRAVRRVVLSLRALVDALLLLLLPLPLLHPLLPLSPLFPFPPLLLPYYQNK
jgi:hypothetical protein